MMKFQLLFILLIGGLLSTHAQPCTKTDDLLSIPGSLKDHTKFPVGGGTFTAIEKPVAMKTLIAGENLCKKIFTLKGGEASSWFHLEDGGFVDTYPVTSYRMKIGFYQHACVNGKKVNSDEYGVDFNIIINPELDDHYPLASQPSATEFYQNYPKQGYLPLSVFRYLSMTAAMGESISNGKGFTDNTLGNNYYAHTDVYRNWYITKPGTPVLIAVSRKEFLESMLECYDREKLFVSKRMKAKIEESVRYMAQYQKSGNKAMYQSHLENKQAAEKTLADLEAVIRNKKQPLEQLLKKDTDWQQQPASVDPDKHPRFDERNTSQSMLFTGFVSGPKAHTIYRYNPAIATPLKAQPAQPLFFLVQYRYKSEEKFSQQITDTFVKNFDFDALRKLL